MSERMSDEEFERLTSKHWAKGFDCPTGRLEAEARRARESEATLESERKAVSWDFDVNLAKIAKLEAALREIAYPKRGADADFDGYHECIALAALEASKPVPHESRTIPAPTPGMSQNEPLD